MTDRLRRTVRLGDMLDPETLFTTLPPRLAEECRLQFRYGRAEQLERYARAGKADLAAGGKPAGPEWRGKPFTGRTYDGRGEPTPEYAEYWQAFYADATVGNARAAARRLLEKHRADGE